MEEPGLPQHQAATVSLLPDYRRSFCSHYISIHSRRSFLLSSFAVAFGHISGLVVFLLLQNLPNVGSYRAVGRKIDSRPDLDIGLVDVKSVTVSNSRFVLAERLELAIAIDSTLKQRARSSSY